MSKDAMEDLTKIKGQHRQERETWIDNSKVIACILVVLGHFFQSMVKSGIFRESSLHLWFDRTIYCFHVPLFFICSGYLYQKYNKVENFEGWKRNVLKKALVLGIPYFTFSTVTWVLKTLFSGSVNEKTGGLFEILFLKPSSPYWYLYCLFFLFLITPTFQSKGMTVGGVGVALCFKAASLFGGVFHLYAISSVLANEIWFVGGMCLSVINIQEKVKRKVAVASAIMGMLFLVLSVYVYVREIRWNGIDFLLGVAACIVIVTGMASLYKNRQQNKILEFLAQYTLPIFLMHTLFAAPMRIILLKVGIGNSIVHTVIGIGISFAGPIVIAEMMARIGYLDFLLYPNRYLKKIYAGMRGKGKYE